MVLLSRLVTIGNDGGLVKGGDGGVEGGDSGVEGGDGGVAGGDGDGGTSDGDGGGWWGGDDGGGDLVMTTSHEKPWLDGLALAFCKAGQAKARKLLSQPG